jgi:hypothetical protein
VIGFGRYYSTLPTGWPISLTPKPAVTIENLKNSPVRVALSTLYLPFDEIDLGKPLNAPPGADYFEDLEALLAVIENDVRARDDAVIVHNRAELESATTITIKPHFSQIWLEEEGDGADQVISITKYQNFIFTLVVIAFYIVAAWRLGGLPELPESIVWLIGISHAGYVGGKIPDKGSARPRAWRDSRLTDTS